MRDRVRAVRNDAHAQLKPWDAIAAQWRRLPSRVIDAYLITPLLRDLYRFLAPRYMPVDEWPLMLSNQRALDENRTYGSVVTWFEDGAHGP